MSLIPMNNIVATYRKNTSTDGNAFSARPLKHWRKQYQNILGVSRASVGMPMDRPGGFMTVASTNIQCKTCNSVFPAQIDIFKNSNCTSCNPIKTKVKPLVTDFTNTNAYFQSRCLTYDQKLSTTRIESSINYFNPDGTPVEPSNSSNGSQVYSTVNCYNDKPPLVCNTSIYKPNNTQFAQQGGVSSSTRLARLKYNTLNNMPVVNNGITVNGSVFNTAVGAMGLNSGRYQLEPTTSYYTKPKPQATVCYRRNGDKFLCPIPPELPTPPPPPPIVKYNYVYVSNINTLSLNVYQMNDNGLLLEPPIQSLSLANNGLTGVPYASTIVTINDNNFLYVTCSIIGYSAYNLVPSISSFSINSDGTLSPLFLPITGLYRPWDITSVTINTNTYLYVIDQILQSILTYSVDPNGQLHLLTPFGASLNFPSAITSITINDIPYIFVANVTIVGSTQVGSMAIYSVDEFGQLTLETNNTINGLIFGLRMTSVVLENNIYLYITNINSIYDDITVSTILMFSIDKTTLTLTPLQNSPLNANFPTGITSVNIVNNIPYVYITDYIINSYLIYTLDPNGNLVTLITPNPVTTFNGPVYISILPYKK